MSKVLILLSLAVMTAVAADVPNDSIFKARLVVSDGPEAPIGRFDEMYRPVVTPSGGTIQEHLFVDRKLLLDRSDLEGAKVGTERSSGNPQLVLIFTEEGRKHLARVTRQNIHKRIAFIVDGKILTAPKIETELPFKELPMGSAGLSRDEVEKLSAKINAATNTSAADTQKLSSGNNAFAFSLAKELASEKPGENIFISPYSISTALQMVRAGAAGETKSEMDQVLGVQRVDNQTLGQAYKDLDSAIRAAASNAVLTVANAIWYAPNIQLKPDFTALNENFYGAKLSPLDFTDPRASGMVNAWVNEATRGKITKIVEGPMSGMTGAFLCNAIYFKGTWEKQFAPSETQDRQFNLPYGRQKTIPTMRQKREFQYRETETFQAVRLAYAGSRLGMYVFLPKTNSNRQSLMDELSKTGWTDKLLAKFSRREGTLTLPKLKLEYSAELKKPLNAIGLRRAFAHGADFLAMSSVPLAIDSVKHKSFVEVNEEGTEAAAVTGITMKMTAVIKENPPFQMNVDHPYVFMIEDGPSHTILFLGEIVEP